MLDIEALLERHNIDYIATRSDVYVQCPFCKDDDQGHHMGISLRGRGWGCWRNARHRGRNLAQLIAELLHVPMDIAKQMTGEDHIVLSSDEGLSSLVRGKLMPETVVEVQRKLSWPKEIKTLTHKSPRQFAEYIVDRGYAAREVPDFCHRFRLRYSMIGMWRYRIVIPVYSGNKLVTWTGRTIAEDTDPRYLTLSAKEDTDGPVALTSITETLFNEDRLMRSEGKELLFVCEGPFDAMRMEWYAKRADVRATCLFGKTISETQLGKLSIIGRGFKRKILMLDPDAAMDTFKLWTQLQPMGFEAIKLDKKWGDPGGMPDYAVEDLTELLLRRRRHDS